jgi:hypothetical protein
VIGGVAAVVALAATVAGVVVYMPRDVTADAALAAYLEQQRSAMFIAWVLLTVSGLAWVVLAASVRSALAAGPAATTFLVAVVAGQSATWAGSAMETAATDTDAGTVPLSVYSAFHEAGHLAAAAGTASIGVALVALGLAARSSGVLSRLTARVMLVAGVILIPAAVVGPVALPLTLIVLLVLAVGLLRPARGPDAPTADQAIGSFAASHTP